MHDERKPNGLRVDWLLLVISYIGFVSLGLPDAIGGLAWPSVRDLFGVPQSYFGQIALVLGCGYFVSSILAGRLSQLLGIGNLLALSCLLVALGLFGFTGAPAWWLFVSLALLCGLGSGAIDSALNAYVASHFPAKHVNWLHACYSVGATIGPLAMTAAIVWSQSWRAGYWVVGGGLLLMALLFAATRRRWGAATDDSTPTATNATLGETLVEPLVWGHIGLFLVYGGLEATVGQWTYTVFTESRHVEPGAAGIGVGCYYGAIGLGRVLAGFVVERIGVDRLIRLSTVGALLGTMALAFSQNNLLGLAGLVLIGLSLAPIFPCLMVRTPQRLGGSMAAHAIGLQVSGATIGIAAMPGLGGLLAQYRGLEMIPTLAVVLALLMLVGHEVVLRLRLPRAQQTESPQAVSE